MEYGLKSQRELAEVLTIRRWHRPDHHIAAPSQRQHKLANELAQPSLQQIPLHRCMAELGHHNAHSHKRKRGRTRANDETTRLQSPSLFADPVDVLAPSDSRRTWIPQGLCGVLRRKLYRQALPSLLSTPAQYCSSPSGGHACPKSMGADSALVPRTVCRLAHSKVSKRSTSDSCTRRGSIDRYLLSVNGLRLARFPVMLTFPQAGPTFSPLLFHSHSWTFLLRKPGIDSCASRRIE